MVSAYFKNIAQTKTLIELLQQRSEIQTTSSVDMKSKFLAYSLELQEVLIGTPHSSGGVNEQIEQILIQLRERQVAKEKVETHQLKERAATQERTLREADATAERLRLEGEGEARKVEQVGLAQARATQAQVNAFGGPQFQLTQQVMARFAEAIERGKVDIVPKVMVGGGGGGDGKDGMQGNIFSALMALMLASRSGMGEVVAPLATPAPPTG